MKATDTKTEATVPVAPEVNPPIVQVTFEDALGIVIDNLKGRLAASRPDIMSGWGRYAERGQVAPMDKGTTIDAKRVPDLLKAAKVRGESTLVDACEDYIGAARALSALAKL